MALSLDSLRVETPTAERATATTPTVVDATASEAAPELYRTTETATASTAGPAREASAFTGSLASAAAEDAEATGYSALTGEVDPTTMTSAGQFDAITSRDSQNMRRAAEQGSLLAAGRGLQNSSFAAGAAQGAMIDRATPLAQQDASTHFTNMRSNLDAQNRASEVSTGRETDISALNAQLGTDVSLQNALMSNDMEKFNAEIQTRVEMANAQAENQIAMLNAQLETAVAEGNRDAANALMQQLNALESDIAKFNANAKNMAEMANADASNRASMLGAELETQTSMADAAAQNAMMQQAMELDAALNAQYLAGEQAMDLADVHGRWSAVISSSQVAGSIWAQHLASVSEIMSNPEIKPDRIASYIQTMTRQLDGALEFIDGISSIEFEEPGMGPFPTDPTPVPPPTGAPPVPGAPTPAPGGRWVPPPGFLDSIAGGIGVGGEGGFSYY